MRVEIDMTAMGEIQSMVSEIKNGYQRVLSGAINKTLTTVKTQAAARIGNELNLKASRIKEDLTLQKASFTNLQGALVAVGKPLELSEFGATQSDVGISVKVAKTGSKTLLKHAYYGKEDSHWKQQAYWRLTPRSSLPSPKRFPQGKRHRSPWPKFGTKFISPVEHLTGPRIEDILAKDSVFEPITIQANWLFAQNVDAMILETIRRFG